MHHSAFGYHMGCHSYDHFIFHVKFLREVQINLDIKYRVIITMTHSQAAVTVSTYVIYFVNMNT